MASKTIRTFYSLTEDEKKKLLSPATSKSESDDYIPIGSENELALSNLSALSWLATDTVNAADAADFALSEAKKACKAAKKALKSAKEALNAAKKRKKTVKENTKTAKKVNKLIKKYKKIHKKTN